MADAVYIGIWQNSSRPGLGGVILTTGDTRGQILVSVLTVFVTIAGGYFWTLVALAVHRAILSRTQVDGLDLQQQVILCNTDGAFSSAWDLMKVWWAWRKSIPHRHSAGSRTAAPLFIALIVWLLVFAIASLLPLFISSGEDAGEQVLVLMKERPMRCGSLDFGQLDPTTIDWDLIKNGSLKFSEDMSRARQLAFERQSTGSERTNLVTFPSASLPSYLTRNVACPAVNTSRCFLGENGAVEVTSGPLDSFELFGINEKRESRITLERKATCSPIRLDGLVHTESVKGIDYDFLVVDMGPDTSQAFNASYWAPKVIVAGSSYLMNRQFYTPDLPLPNFNSWEPTAEFKRDDAEISVLFLDSNGIIYTDPVSDPFFDANDYTESTSVQLVGGAQDIEFYRSDNWVTAMFCTEQYSVCNVRNGMCTAFGGLVQLGTILNDTTLDLNPSQRLSAMRLGSAAGNAPLWQVATLGDDALLASRLLAFGISAPLPNDQWVKEVQYWFNITLVAMQIAIQEYPNSPMGDQYGTKLLPGAEGFSSFEKGPNSDYKAFINAGKSQCGIQLMRSVEGVVNFRMLYVVWVLVVCSIFCILGWTFEPLLTMFIRQRRQWRSKWRKARTADDKLQLLRMAVDNGHSGVQWDAAGNQGGLPVTVGHTLLARPDFDGTKVSYRKVYESIPMGAVQTAHAPSTPYAPSFDSQRPLIHQQPSPGTYAPSPFSPDQMFSPFGTPYTPGSGDGPVYWGQK